jgi:hypothetical protein
MVPSGFILGFGAKEKVYMWAGTYRAVSSQLSKHRDTPHVASYSWVSILEPCAANIV